MFNFSKNQLEYLNDACHRWNIKSGAVRSGKTYLDIAVVIPCRIRAVAGKEGLTVFLGNTKGTIQRNVIEPLQQMYGKNLVSSIRADNTATIFGEKVYCLGASKINQVDVLRGMSIKYCYGDEVVTWCKEVFEMLKSRLDKSYSRCDLTCNPDSPLHWFKEFIDSDVDKYLQEYTIDDNPFLPEEFVRNLKKEYEGSVWYDRLILGKWVRAEGLIYPMFYKDKHCFIEQPTNKYEQYYISADYGILNPFSAGLWGKYMDKWYRIAEYYHDGRKTNKQYTDEEYYTKLLDLAGDLPIRSIIIDPSASSMIATIRKHGKFNIRKAKNDVLEGIRNTATELNKGNILINSKCKAFINEIEGYSWDKDNTKEDKPLKENDHCLTGDTIINTINGDISIKDLVGKSGLVKAYDTYNNKVVTAKFKDVRLTQKNARVFEVKLNSGKIIKATAEHPMYTKRGWVMVRDLRTDDTILDINIGYSYIYSITFDSFQDVYNMEVEKYHNFSINGGLIVHNCMDDFRYFVNTVVARGNTFEVA